VKELLDVVTRVYEYQRPHPTLVGTASGLETVRLALQVKLPTPPIIARLGISLVDASEGRCVFEGSPAEWQYHHIGTVHGGWLSALLDSALGCAVQTVTRRLRVYHARFAGSVLSSLILHPPLNFAFPLHSGCRIGL
jgi:hypothetical protein